ncbi:hypothetical protein D3C72_1672060 [compost metagenome]
MMVRLSLLLKTALATPLVRPLCQKPPSPIIEIARLPAGALSAEAPAPPRPYPIVVLPMLKGGRIENRWQPMSALTWCAPSSRSTSFMALKMGRSGQPVQKPGGRECTTSPSALDGSAGSGAASTPMAATSFSGITLRTGTGTGSGARRS